MTIITELYVVFIPSELQHGNFHNQTLLTYHKPVSHEHYPAFVKIQRNLSAHPDIAYVPTTTDYYLYDHGHRSYISQTMDYQS